MIRNLSFALCFIVLLTGTVLLSANESEEKVESEFYFAPLPSFERMFSALDYLEVSDYNTAVEKVVFTVEEEIYRLAFALGVNTADALIATKARNKDSLLQASSEMINHSRFIGISDEILKLGDELRGLIQREEWIELEFTLERYKEEVELSLYQSRQFDLFTLMQLGGWTQGLNRISTLLVNNYQEDKTNIIEQKGILNALINNLDQIRDDRLKKATYLVNAKEKFTAIKKIIYAKELYGIDNLKELVTITEAVKLGFKK